MVEFQAPEGQRPLGITLHWVFHGTLTELTLDGANERNRPFMKNRLTYDTLATTATLCLFVLSAVLAPRALNAQPFNLDDKIKPVHLKWVDYGEPDGKQQQKVCVAEVTQTEKAMYFFANGISIYEPLYAGVTGDAQTALKVSLHSRNWRDHDRSGKTDDKGHWEDSFKTEGDFGMRVVADVLPVTYTIVLWKGVEARLSPQSPFETADAGSGGFLRFMRENGTWIAIGVLVAMVAFLLFKLKGRRAGQVGSVVLMLGATGQAGAQGQIEAVRQLSADAIAEAVGSRASADQMGAHWATGVGYMSTFVGALPAAQDLYNSLQTLNAEACVPDLSISPEAMVPASCSEESECAECFKGVYTRHSYTLQKLARMRCIYLNTKDFVAKSVAFGDNMSGIHAMTGIAWQQERTGILKSLEQLKGTYDKKYGEFMVTVNKELQEIGECEKQVGEEDWFQKYGFIYFGFLKEKYKRDD